jgi:hypothetical protein
MKVCHNSAVTIKKNIRGRGMLKELAVSEDAISLQVPEMESNMKN